MRKLLIALAALLIPASALAQSLTYSPGQGGAVGNIASATGTNGNTQKVIIPAFTPTDTSGNEKGTTSSPMVVTGNVVSGAADSGAPVKAGGVYNSTLPTFTTGQRGDLQINAKGGLIVGGASNVVGDAIGSAAPAIMGPNGTVGPLLTGGAFYNGSSWDRAFTCANSAAVNVTAGNTAQIVGLSGSTVIRVCSIALSMSAAGTAGVYTGTGTNCATGLTALIQDMTLATGTPLVVSSGAGSVVRSSAGGALCVKAVTGNVTGVITYAQF